MKLTYHWTDPASHFLALTLFPLWPMPYYWWLSSSCPLPTGFSTLRATWRPSGKIFLALLLEVSEVQKTFYYFMLKSILAALLYISFLYLHTQRSIKLTSSLVRNFWSQKKQQVFKETSNIKLLCPKKKNKKYHWERVVVYRIKGGYF